MSSVVSDFVIKQAQGGMPPKRLAEISGLPVGRIYAILARARRRGINIQRFNVAPPGDLGAGGMDGRGVRLSAAFCRDLQRAADRRNVLPHQLAARILAVVIDDGLIDSVLDDLTGAEDAT